MNKPIIMRMKSFCVAILALMTLVACKKESQQPVTSVSVVNTRVEPSAPSTEKKTPSYLEQRVNTIYSKVFAEYNQANELEEIGNIPEPDSLYCSKDWNSWVNKVREYDSENNTDEIGFFEADYWVMGQDFGNLSVSDVKTVSLNDRIGVVELKIHNFDDVIPVRLDMVFEKDEWMIDDFIDMDHNLDWKKEMKEYMRGK